MKKILGMVAIVATIAAGAVWTHDTANAADASHDGATTLRRTLESSALESRATSDTTIAAARGTHDDIDAMRESDEASDDTDNPTQGGGIPPVLTPRVICDGSACFGGGGTIAYCSLPLGHQFVYHVQPNTSSITYLEVGTHWDTAANFKDFCGPPGWTMTWIHGGANPDRNAFDNHGDIVARTGVCPHYLRFTGPAQTADFELGYNFDGDADIHDVGWTLSTGTHANWSAKLGFGQGPIHSPGIH